MRCFLGFDISAPQKLAIESWRERALPTTSHNVPASNFHVTAAFLGHIDSAQHESLCQQLDTLTLPVLDMTFDHVGYWAKPKVLWLGCNDVPPGAIELAQTLYGLCQKSGISIQKRPYVPHITVMRKCSQPPPAALTSPHFSAQFDALHLFESVSTSRGVYYPIRRTWKAAPTFGFRK